MKKEEVIERFCKLSTEVNVNIFDFDIPSDCFCLKNFNPKYFQFDEKILNFIEDAVKTKIDNEN